MTQAQDQYRDQDQGMDGAQLLEEIIARSNLPEYKQVTTYTPFEGTDDNQVSLSPGMVLRFFAKPTKGGKICTYEQAVRFVMLCKARRLDPREGDAFLVGYDTRNGPEFNLITAHQAFLKRADAHKAFQGMESGVTVLHTETEEIRDIEGDYVPEDCTLIGGWARVHRSDRTHPTYRRLDLRSFDKGISVWGTNKAGMITKCAEADGLRSAFPNLTAGMYMAGEIQPSDTAPTEDARTAPQANRSYKMAKAAQDQTAADTGPAAGTGAGDPGSDGPVGEAKGRSSPNQPHSGPLAPTNTPGGPTSPITKGAGGTPTAPAPTGRPKARTGVIKCPNCDCAMAGGICPNCAPIPPKTAQAAADATKPANGGGSPGSAAPEPVPAPPVAEDPVDPPAIDEAALATDEEQAEMYAASDLAKLRNDLTANKVRGGRIQTWALKAMQVAAVVDIKTAPEEKIRHAARVFKLRALEAQ